MTIPVNIFESGCFSISSVPCMQRYGQFIASILSIWPSLVHPPPSPHTLYDRMQPLGTITACPRCDVPGSHATGHAISGSHDTAHDTPSSQDTVHDVSASHDTAHDVPGSHDTSHYVPGSNDTSHDVPGSHDTAHDVTGSQATVHDVPISHDTACP